VQLNDLLGIKKLLYDKQTTSEQLDVLFNSYQRPNSPTSIIIDAYPSPTSQTSNTEVEWYQPPSYKVHDVTLDLNTYIPHRSSPSPLYEEYIAYTEQLRKRRGRI
jgi:hypothetical protein